ncbi:TauD/TfdA family dioxygenase [soil metagenome]
MTSSDLKGTPGRARTLKLRPLTGSVGVEVSGIDLNDDFDENIANQLRDALCGNCVMVVRDQFLSTETLLRLARIFGEPFMPSYYRKNTVEGFPDVAVVPNFGKAKAPAEGWHTDWSHMTVPPTVSVSIPTVLAPKGGDTMFSNQYESYDRLSNGMKEFLDGRRAKFIGTRPIGDDQKVVTGDDLTASAKREDVINFHPITPTHPHTGRKALYLNRPGGSMVEIEGMTPAESFPILEYLYTQSTNPDNVYRHIWEPGDVVCWDNRCAMHYGVHDYGDVERTLHRVTVGGTI